MGVWQELWAALGEPLQLFGDPSKRVFWPALLVSLVLALALSAMRGLPLLGVLSPRLWLHPSARMDYLLLFAKALIRVLLIAPWAGSAYGLAISLVMWLDRTLGRPPDLGWPSWLVSLVYTLVLFVAWDFSRYWLHRWLHTVPLLWEFHKVHHSAEVMTPLTLYRSHPVESVLYTLRGILVSGFLTGVFFYLFRAQAVQVQLLGVNVIGFLFNTLGGNLRHSHVWLSYGPKIEAWLLSPAQHQIHHSDQPEHFDKNFGIWLAIWDRWGGSLVLTGAPQSLKFGLSASELNHDPHRVGSALVGPLAAAFARIGRRLRPRKRVAKTA